MNRVRLLVLNAALGPLDYRLADGQVVEAGSVDPWTAAEALLGSQDL